MNDKQWWNVGYSALGVAVLLLSIQAVILSWYIPSLRPERYTVDDMKRWCVAAEAANPGWHCPEPTHLRDAFDDAQWKFWRNKGE